MIPGLLELAIVGGTGGAAGWFSCVLPGTAVTWRSTAGRVEARDDNPLSSMVQCWTRRTD
eukprot:scaffold106241_cov65-Phaeocystis_antarctica.AAC.2